MTNMIKKKNQEEILIVKKNCSKSIDIDRIEFQRNELDVYCIHIIRGHTSNERVMPKQAN